MTTETDTICLEGLQYNISEQWAVLTKNTYIFFNKNNYGNILQEYSFNKIKPEQIL